jgi:hypothetical protein
MIFVIAPGTGELVSLRMLRRMRLPLRHGWDGWVFKDKLTGKTRRFQSYRLLRIHLEHIRQSSIAPAR